MQVADLRPGGNSADLASLQNSTLKSSKTIRLFAANPAILHYLAIVPQEVAVGGIGVDRRMAVDGFFKNHHLGRLRPKFLSERVGRIENEIGVAHWLDPRRIELNASSKRMNAALEPRGMNLVASCSHLIKSSREHPLADLIFSKNRRPVRIDVNERESGAFDKLDPIIDIAIFNGSEYITPPRNFAVHRPRATGIGTRHACGNGHCFELFAKTFTRSDCQECRTPGCRKLPVNPNAKIPIPVGIGFNIATSHRYCRFLVGPRIDVRALPLRNYIRAQTAEFQCLKILERTFSKRKLPAAIESRSFKFDLSHATRENKCQLVSRAHFRTTGHNLANAFDIRLHKRNPIARKITRRGNIANRACKARRINNNFTLGIFKCCYRIAALFDNARLGDASCAVILIPL